MMTDKVLQAIRKYGLFSPGDSILVALSGGADSVALLFFMSSIRSEYALRLHAAHLNHNLRGQESERDEQFVRDLCGRLNVPLTVESLPIADLAKRDGLSIEECGRTRRYALFARLAGGNSIATAHTLSDSAETFFINVLRGSGLKGLCGIPPKRGNIIRPLIDCTRAEILQYCQKHALVYVEDSTNQSDLYLRNRIRHHIIPQLEQLGDPYPAFERMFETLSMDEALLEKQTASLVDDCLETDGYHTAPLLAAEPALTRRALRAICMKEAGQCPEKRHIDTMEGFLDSGGQLQLPGGSTVRVLQGKLEFGAEHVPEAGTWEYDVQLDQWIGYPGGYFCIKTIELEKNNLIHKKLLNNWIDYDKIIGKISVRNRRAGDRIRIAGRGVTKSLKKWMNEKKTPISMRGIALLVQDEQGIIWAEGIGVAQRCAADQQTRRVLMVQLQGDENESRH